jgi:hypothetical protein
MLLGTFTRRHRHKNRKTYKQKQNGGSGHIYTIPIESLYNTIYELTNEMIDLRSKCNSTCMQKLCTSSDPGICNQTRTMMYYNNVYEITNICNMQLVRMTDPTGSQCQTAKPPANCICELYMKKYKEFERIIADLDMFISNYYIDTPVKRYIQSIREVAQSIRMMFDNFNIGVQLRNVPTELKSKSMNDIMQTPEFKEALRSTVTAAIPRPVSAPSRLELPPSPTLTTNFAKPVRKGFVPKTIARRNLLGKLTNDARVFNSLTHMNN